MVWPVLGRAWNLLFALRGFVELSQSGEFPFPRRFKVVLNGKYMA